MIREQIRKTLYVRFLHVVFTGSIRQLVAESLRCVCSVNVFVFLRALLKLMMSPLIVAQRNTLPPLRGTGTLIDLRMDFRCGLSCLVVKTTTDYCIVIFVIDNKKVFSLNTKKKK